MDDDSKITEEEASLQIRDIFAKEALFWINLSPPSCLLQDDKFSLKPWDELNEEQRKRFETFLEARLPDFFGLIKEFSGPVRKECRYEDPGWNDIVDLDRIQQKDMKACYEALGMARESAIDYIGRRLRGEILSLRPEILTTLEKVCSHLKPLSKEVENTHAHPAPPAQGSCVAPRKEKRLTLVHSRED